jgi:hypothetical protein
MPPQDAPDTEAGQPSATDRFAALADGQEATRSDPAFSDQVPGCVGESCRGGVDARHLEGVAMPCEYDTESGRGFHNRFPHPMRGPMNRHTERRAAVVNTLMATS